MFDRLIRKLKGYGIDGRVTIIKEVLQEAYDEGYRQGQLDKIDELYNLQRQSVGNVLTTLVEHTK